MYRFLKKELLQNYKTEAKIIKNVLLSKGLIFTLVIFFISISSIPLIANIEKEHVNYLLNGPLSSIQFEEKPVGTLPANTFLPTDDTFISENNPDGNMGSIAWLRVRGYTGSKLYTLIKFNISSVPSDAVINSATLHLYYLKDPEEGNPAGQTLEIHRILNNWNEGIVTWNIQPAHNQTATSSAIVPDTPYVWMTWNVTSDVQSFVNSAKTNYGWKIIDIVNSSDTPYFYSKEYNSLIPYLEIDYTSAEKNIPPTAEANGPYTGYVNHEMIFNGSGSTDSDGSITGYRWDWNNDGIFDTGWLTSSITSHTFTTSGTYIVKLQVKDNDNALGNDTAIVTVRALNGKQPPKANAGGPYFGIVGSPITFNGSGSTDTNRTIVSYVWNFGDRVTGTGVSPTHTYTTAGNYTVTLTVTDNESLTDSDSTNASINASQPPTIVIAVNVFNIEPIEEENEETIPVTVFCYHQSVSNIHLEILESSNLTIYLISPNVTLNPTERKELLINIKAPKLEKRNNSQNQITSETITLRAVGDGNITSNTEQINIKVIGKKATPDFETIIVIGAIALVLFWKRKNLVNN
jgi:hypothetical protein